LIKKEFQADDAGGPTRQFFDQVWLQLGDLQVKMPNSTNAVKLFAMTQGGLIPQPDDYLSQYFLNMDNMGKDGVMEKIRSYYRAVGRMMAHCMLLSSEDFGPLTIASHTLPLFYLNGESQ
jgi:hypothetical protein